MINYLKSLLFVLAVHPQEHALPQGQNHGYPASNLALPPQHRADIKSQAIYYLAVITSHAHTHTYRQDRLKFVCPCNHHVSMQLQLVL